MLAAVAFLDAFQKVADMATNTRGRVLPTQGWVSPGLARQGAGWRVSPCGLGGLQAAAPPCMETCSTCPHPEMERPLGSRVGKTGCS